MNLSFSRSAILIFITTLLCASESAYAADDWNFKSSFNIGFRTLDFGQDFEQGTLYYQNLPAIQSAARTTDYKVDFKSIDLTLAAAWKQWFATFNYERSLDTQDGTFDSTYASSNGNPASHGQASFAFDREDFAFTLGWNAVGGLSIFTGYKYGQTDTSRPAKTLNQAPIYASSSFKEDGPFAGLGYSWAIGHGILTTSVAYAYMNGKFSSQGEELIFQTANSALTYEALNYNGHTDGLSCNLSWNVQATDSIGYYYGVKYQHYSFNADTSETWKLYDLQNTNTYLFSGNGKVNNVDTVTAFYAGVNYTF